MPTERPNVLVLLADQQRADTLDLESLCVTPNVDRLASEGTRFSRCYAPNPICSPSRASLMTGELPHTHGMVDCTHTVPEYRAEFRADLPTWSERLADAGYYQGYVGKWHVERSGDLSRFGFDEYACYGSESFREAFRDHRRDLGLPADPDRSHASVPETGTENVHTAAGAGGGEDGLDLAYTVRQPGYDDLTLYGTHGEPAAGERDYYAYDRGVEFVRDAADRDGPWSLTVSTFAPHDPFVVPREYYERYDPGEIPKPESFDDDLSDRPGIYDRQREVWEGMDWERFAEATACYYALCSFLDDQVGRLLDALEETGQLEETVVVYASDHGDLLGAHGLLLKGVPAFEETYRVPMVVCHPNAEDGRVCRDRVQLQDLAPTLADLGGADPIDCFGDSLVPFLRGERPDDHADEAFAEFHGQRFSWTQRVLWRGTWKYVFNGFDRDELYDLEADPRETENLADDPAYDDVAADMADRMWEIARETGDDSLVGSQYGMFRFAPVGPNGKPAADARSDADGRSANPADEASPDERDEPSE